eukprot:6186986-Pleurochrysis_carterae.AAC.5
MDTSQISIWDKHDYKRTSIFGMPVLWNFSAFALVLGSTMTSRWSASCVFPILAVHKISMTMREMGSAGSFTFSHRPQHIELTARFQ